MKNLNLNYEGFENYLFNKRNMIMDREMGVQYEFHFPNDYGASVIKHEGSYGYNNDLWEVAILENVIDKNSNSHWVLCYDTELTDDVIGYLTDEEVRELLGKIKEL